MKLEQRRRTASERLGGLGKLLRLHRGETRSAYDGVAVVYDEFVQVWDRHVAAPALAYYDELIRRHVLSGAVVLDAGAGTGERTLALLRHGQPNSVVALDASAEMLKIARAKVHDPRVRFTLGDVTRLPFEDDTFDIVSSTWVVEILPDPRAAVRELIRVVKPTGVVLYAFCSLPEGRTGDVAERAIEAVSSERSPLTHLLAERERPYHRCERSSLRQFAGGLTTVATVAKCCPIDEALRPCHSGGR